MRDIREVLREKEARMTHLRKEVEALRVVAPLLANPGEAPQVGPQAVQTISLVPTTQAAKVDLASYLTDANQ